MNYIILNGVKSTLIKGLLIQSLPPISKPLMRTQIEEIDGRDGDIVTKLGYSAYDKDVSIGLFGDFDINEVISFFDSEGTVIFSNEPDKFYKYQVIDQIDFERLIRFKTATVRFHVQPFKFSAVDTAMSLDQENMEVKDYSFNKNGVAVHSQDGTITVSGLASSATEVYIPIEEMDLRAGTYTLKATTEGTGESSVIMRVIDKIPSNDDSLGQRYLTLEEDGEASFTTTLLAFQKFNYVWLRIPQGSNVNFTLTVSVYDENFSSVEVFNRGNVFSKPKITIHGSGTINLTLNEMLILVINLADAGYITIDAQEMNAYKGNTFMNRFVMGDYSDLAFKVGKNTLSWTGNVTGMEIDNFTRWI